MDPAENILAPAPLDDSTKADVWDHWHAAKTLKELSTRLRGLNLPVDVQQQLLDAKQLITPSPTPTDKVADAIQAIGRMEPRTLDWAEQNVDKFMAMLGH